MFQDTHIFPEMTVLENMLIADKRKYGEQPFISLFKSKKSQRIEKERIDAAKSIFYELFGEDNTLWNKRNEAAGVLSYGQQRLLGLARIFMGNYKLVLLDEPTSGINPQLIAKILEIIKKMVKEKDMAVLLIEHNMKVVLDIADFCSFMSHGKITAFGTPDDVLGNDAVRKDYLGI
jgi:branched-chain amino acid transport system ATP-binding protein